MVTVRFSEFEACVSTILSKVKEALGQQESITLTDSQGNKIIDSEGTRGTCHPYNNIDPIRDRNSIYKGWIFLFDLQRSSEQTSLLNMLQKLHWLQ
uniref:Uncharacterized protein n=1 Tax=Knipowitschia caucasica TaxID=637954 RepID=A0AAV2L932_KNICA